MKKTTGLLLAALAAAPLSLQAQTPDAPAHRGPHGGTMRGPGGLTAMLQRHADPGLTAEQTARLQAIEAELRARNEPLRQQLQALRPEGARAERPRMSDAQRQAMREARARGERPERGERPARPQLTDEQRAQMRARMEQARPIMEQMRANGQAAMEQARAVLTAEQRATLERRMQERRPEMRERRGERGPRAPRGERAPRTR